MRDEEKYITFFHHHYFVLSLSLVRTFVFANKPDDVIDLEDLQKTANERYITAQILSQSLDNVYKLFEINLAT